MSDQETNMANGYKVGQKVQFKHGRGWAMGTVQGRDGDKFKILTAGGATVNRNASSLGGPATTTPATATGEPA